MTGAKRMAQYDPRESWIGFLFVAGIVITVIFSLLMPASSQPVHMGWLFVFWGAHVSAGLIILNTVQAWISGIPKMKSWSVLWITGLSGLFSAALFAPLAYLLDYAFAIPEDADDIAEGLVGGLIGEFFGLLPLFLVVWLALNAIRFIRIQPLAKSSGQFKKKAPSFWNRIPKALGRDIVALSAELHYLRVYTTNGDALILFPFGQAVSELDGFVEGRQIHRSHWVALSHISTIEPRGQGGLCKTKTGLSLPVSRTRKKALDLLSQATV